MATVLDDISSMENRLVAIYKRAYADLLNTIERKQTRGSMAEFERGLLADVQGILEGLGVDMREWASKDLPLIYQGGAEACYEAFIKAGAEVPPFNASFSLVNQGAVKVIAANMTAQLEAAHITVGRRLQGMVRDVQLQVIASKEASGLTIQQTKKVLMQRLGDEGLTCFTDARGRNYRLDKYSEMCARTVTREATNTGVLDQMQELGRDLVKMDSHFGTCSICAPYAGRIYSVTGKDGRYPSLRSVPGFSAGYQTIHPNCKHVVMPYVEELADDPEKDRERSNKPFKDDRTRAQVEAYETAQKKKAQANADLHQYEAMKGWLPNDAPKSFSGFRRMKSANSNRYQELKQMEREVRTKARAASQ